MASDISSLLGSELKNTFESLLSVEATINDISKSSLTEIDSEECVEIILSMTSKSISSNITFYLPTFIATKFEFFMLGGIGDLKTSIDGEIIDATKEIINTVGGSLATTINAQYFDDLTNVSLSQISGESIITNDRIEETNNLYKIDISFNDENLEFFISFEDALIPHVSKISSGEELSNEEETKESHSMSQNINKTSSILSLLGPESTENLKLLFDVKLKFSVRLGTKTFLLKDIVNWDVGHIIELEQMVNEPLDILVNGTKVGEGEAVIVEGRFGIKIRNIGDREIEV